MKYIYDDLVDKNILITGGAGFIGSNLALYFQKHHPGANVCVFDKFRDDTYFPSGNPTSLGHFKNLLDFRGEVIVGDLTKDLNKLKGRDFDYIFHQAAISDTTAMDQKLMLETNFEAFVKLYEIAKQSGAMLIYASSAGTYGNSSAPNIVGVGEVPENIYGYSKLQMDIFTRQVLAQDSEIPLIGLRYFNVYGEQLRDFVYIKDVIQANVKAIEASASGVYNVGSGKARSFNDIINELKRHLGDFEVEYIDNPYTFYQNHTQADIALSQEFLSYTPRFSLEQGIESYIPEILNIFNTQMHKKA
ncbi:MAG: NAD-dependent epimerase/dehydratase family protein [Helicobacter sp.]|nr:NAD-dependent epimerase/dehydratase family protein [Helicobacter sp.]